MTVSLNNHNPCFPNCVIKQLCRSLSGWSERVVCRRRTDKSPLCSVGTHMLGWKNGFVFSLCPLCVQKDCELEKQSGDYEEPRFASPAQCIGSSPLPCFFSPIMDSAPPLPCAWRNILAGDNSLILPDTT